MQRSWRIPARTKGQTRRIRGVARESRGSSQHRGQKTLLSRKIGSLAKRAIEGGNMRLSDVAGYTKPATRPDKRVA
jgi:hypothetical protein